MASSKLWIRHYILKFFNYLHVNVFIEDFFNSSQDLGRSTEATLRYLQYKHYKKNKDKTFQFMDLGIFDKYPYPPPEEKS